MTATAEVAGRGHVWRLKNGNNPFTISWKALTSDHLARLQPLHQQLHVVPDGKIHHTGQPSVPFVRW